MYTATIGISEPFLVVKCTKGKRVAPMDIQREQIPEVEMCENACMYNINEKYEEVLGYSYTKEEESCVCVNGEKDEGGKGTKTCAFKEKTSKMPLSVILCFPSHCVKLRFSL